MSWFKLKNNSEEEFDSLLYALSKWGIDCFKEEGPIQKVIFSDMATIVLWDDRN